MSLCNTCGGNLCGGCGQCGQCQPKCGCEKKCPKPCGCPESILSIEAETTRPAYLRFNLGGRSVWYDFTSVVKAAETCTKLKTDIPSRSLIYDAECGRQTITASEIGSILHLSDIGDVDTSKIKDNAILVYRKNSRCGENCEGATGWVGLDLSEAGNDSLRYIMGSNQDGEVMSLRPPANSNQHYMLEWDGKEMARWKQPKEVSSVPKDADGYSYRLYLDPNTREIVFVKVRE